MARRSLLIHISFPNFAVILIWLIESALRYSLLTYAFRIFTACLREKISSLESLLIETAFFGR
jgi:hypothetical protein